MGAQFSRFVILCRFFVFLGDPSKIAVLPAWELNSVSIPPSPQPLRIAQDDPRWSNMAQDGSKMAQDGPSNSRV